MPTKRTRAATKQGHIENEHIEGDDHVDGVATEEPPQLEREEGPTEDIVVTDEWGQPVGTYAGPGGQSQLFDEDEVYYVDENGILLDRSAVAATTRTPRDPRTIEFNFLDNTNICCGICGEVVPYELLMSEHLPTQHPDVLGDGVVDLEEIPYEDWLREKYGDKRPGEGGYGGVYYDAVPRVTRSVRTLRRVSQIRVNPQEMTLAQLDVALKRKMVEKMGRKVPVSLVDKQHARCGICQAVVSLNKKFEIAHLVRHFNAWHPTAHKCSGTWFSKEIVPGMGKPLSSQDFAVIDNSLDAQDNLQCIWCGMFMDTHSIGMHFHEVHPEEIELPKCNLCLLEIIMNARLKEKYGDEFEVTLPDERTIRCGRFGSTHKTEQNLDRAIERNLARIQAGEMPENENEEPEEDPTVGPAAYSNSRMKFGRRSKPKRQFIMPALRQAAPINSKYVHPITECHWKCKLCGKDILAAVISAGSIRHFRKTHPEHLESLQFELCKTRLERISDGCMEVINPSLVECLICGTTYTLPSPFTINRAVHHLKAKHPDVMPEYSGRARDTNIDQVVGPSKKKIKFTKEQEPEYEMEEVVVDETQLLRDGAYELTEEELAAETSRIVAQHEQYDDIGGYDNVEYDYIEQEV